MHSTNKQLKEVISTYGLTRKQVAEMTMCSSKSTVDRWLMPFTRGGHRNTGYRMMPEHRMKMLLDTIRSKRLKKVEQNA
jgi:hypothetical protein